MNDPIETPEEPVGRLTQIGIDANDLDRAERFWSAVLGLKPAQRLGTYRSFERQNGHPVIYLQQVPETRISKTRLHFDVAVDDVDRALKRVEAMGGTKLEVVEELDTRWFVVADTEGNAFCLISDGWPL